MDMKEIEKFEPKVGTLKLSEAIREGRKLRDECSGNWAYMGKSCALVAGLEASGIDYETTKWYGEFIFTEVQRRFGVPPHVALSIPHMMDTQGLSSERVADWLASQGY